MPDTVDVSGVLSVYNVLFIAMNEALEEDDRAKGNDSIACSKLCRAPLNVILVCVKLNTIAQKVCIDLYLVVILPLANKKLIAFDSKILKVNFLGSSFLALRVCFCVVLVYQKLGDFGLLLVAEFCQVSESLEASFVFLELFRIENDFASAEDWLLANAISQLPGSAVVEIFHVGSEVNSGIIDIVSSGVDGNVRMG